MSFGDLIFNAEKSGFVLTTRERRQHAFLGYYLGFCASESVGSWIGQQEP
jgi:hypothetical protein